MRAWISQYLVTVGNGAETFSKVPKIDTTKFSSEMLKNLAKMTQDSLRLNHIKPLEIKHGFTAVQTAEGQGAKSTAYKNKLSKNQNVVVSAKTSQGTEINYYGTTGPVDGRTAGLNLPHTLDDSKTILSIKSIGRDDPTTAEAQRAAAILRILQGKTELLTENPWMQNIWFPAPADESGNFEPLRWPPDWSNGPSDKSAKDNLDRLNLNRSQQTAVDTMLSRTDTNRITIIQGPPGTGKTSVIAAFVKVAIEASQSGIWLVAKSNVAVINIAIKLTSAGFTDWRLLGAKDFSHADWHGHLYDGIRDRFIRSDEFRKMSASRIKGCQVILCTTAMVSIFLCCTLISL
ncbi:hypothetical protein C8J57DRAFT_709618 [Mycena rebaudengoi]|nr:hypothetical protein C8J57DRAFT_709618 [Mycena rebaudengoi]